MKRNYKDTDELMARFSKNKEIPSEYREEILVALSHFPELTETRISFRMADFHKHPCYTSPVRSSRLAPAGKRSYTVHIARKSGKAPEQALMHHLPFEARVAAIAHELAHVLQLEKNSSVKALRMALQGSGRTQEREADISVIEHGLGFELYTHASYLRTIPGLIEAYRHADINRLHPNEILEALPPDQLHEVHRF